MLKIYLWFLKYFLYSLNLFDYKYIDFLFNKLIEIIKDYISNKKQIILGSNIPLDELNINEELKENILWGISVNIEEDLSETNNEKLKDYNWLK